MNSFFPRKGYRTTAILFLLFFVAIGTGSACVAWTELPEDRRVIGVSMFSTFWGTWAALAAWMLLASYRVQLHVWGDNLIWQGAIFQKQIPLSNVTEARWIGTNRGSLKLTTPTFRLTIDFDLFQPEERLWLIQFFRSKLPESVQREWGRFCYAVALPLRDSEPPATPPLSPDKMLLTRRRWDWYFIPFVLVCAVMGIVLFAVLQQPRMLAAPLFPLPLWLWLRFMTPKNGIVYARIKTNSGTIRFLLGLFLWAVLGISGMFLFKFLDLPKPQAEIAGPVALFSWMGVLLWRARLADLEFRKQEPVKIQNASRRWDEMGMAGSETAVCGTAGNERQLEP